MQNRQLIGWMLSLLCITAGLLLWHHYGMNRTLTINQATSYPLQSYDDRLYGGTSVANVSKQPQAIVLDCQLTSDYEWPYCGFMVRFSKNTSGVDFSKFNTISLNIHVDESYTAPIRVYLRNFNPAYSTKGHYKSLKVNQFQYFPDKSAHPLTLPLQIFQVASWWINTRRIPPQYAVPDIRNVMTLEIALGDRSEPGHYKVSLYSITFHGKWLSKIQLLSIILALWLLSSLFYLSSTLWRATHTMHTVGQQKRELEEINAALNIERQELETRATHDELTKAYNRGGLRDRLYEMVSRVKRGKETLSIIFMDIDHFKEINDQHGHLAGDEVLTQLADFVMQHTRSEDYFCRWGGEEFILLCSNTTLEHARVLAEKLRALINAYDWPYGIALRCSFGVSQMERNEGAENFLRRADEALYEAKSSGRNRVECSTYSRASKK